MVEPVRIEITSPANGGTINRSSTIVQGRIYNQTGETGVVVNGVLAEVQGNDFAAIVPLQIGQNVITATAARPDGLQGQAQITINTETQQEFIRLTATPMSSVLDQAGILNVAFEVEAYLVNPITSYSWDFNGDGTPEITATEASVTAQYQFPGLYFPRVTVTDNQGNTYTETTLVNVLSREEVDALLRSKWEGTKGGLASQNIDGALNYFAEESRQLYSEIFVALYAQLPQIVQQMQDIELIYSRNNISKYRIRKNESYGGQTLSISYYIYFIIDRDGIWRIYNPN